MLIKYFNLLKKKDFSFLWFSQIISQFGDRLTQVALVGLVSKASMSSSSLAIVMSMATIPVFIFSPISGVYIDRWSKRKTMYLSDLLRGIFIILIPIFFFIFKSLWPIYILIFLSFSAGRFFIPAKMAFIPELVEKKDIFLANSLISVTGSIAAVLGIGLGGIIVDNYGVTNAFYIDSSTFIISGLCIFFISKIEGGKILAKDILNLSKDVVGTVKNTFIFEFKEGLKYIFNSHETKYAFKTYLFLFSYIGSLYVVMIRFIQNTLSTVTKDLGFAAVALGAGIFIGSLVYGWIAHKVSIKKIINIAVLSSSLFLIFFVILLKNYPYTLCAILLSFILGLNISPAFIGVNALIHKSSDKKLLGRIFSGLEFISHLGFLISMFISSFFADLFNPFTVIKTIGIIGFIFSLILFFNNDKQ